MAAFTNTCSIAAENSLALPLAPYVPSAPLRPQVYLELAISVIGTDVQWSNDAARQERLVALPDEAVEELNDLDHAFFGYPDNLTTLLYNYVCAHRAQFGASKEF
jgi:hypothetical protein